MGGDKGRDKNWRLPYREVPALGAGSFTSAAYIYFVSDGFVKRPQARRANPEE